MELANDILQQYVGGQLEVQNPEEGYLFRGKIRTVGIQDEDLVVEFVWLAEGEGYPPLPKKWVKVKPEPYQVNSALFTASDIGDDRICLTTLLHETAVFFLAKNCRFDSSAVEGLEPEGEENEE